MRQAFYVTLLLLAVVGCGTAVKPARFAFTDVDPGKEFVIELRDPQKIAHARRVLSGDETAAVHVLGTVNKSPASYNQAWSYHLQHESIEFFEVAIEVCDLPRPLPLCPLAGELACGSACGAHGTRRTSSVSGRLWSLSPDQGYA